MFRIAIIGRPNVGKSTLFNKLIGKNFAITDDTPGVTRDRKEAQGKLGPLEFIAIDTAGLEHHITDASLEKRMVEQTQFAVDDADLCLFVVDGKLGLNNDDFYFADWLRKIKKPTILVANKCENLNEEIFGKEFYRLGFGKPTGVSAEHKLGFGDLYDKIAPEIEKYEEIFAELNVKNNDSFEDENFIEEVDEIINIDGLQVIMLAMTDLSEALGYPFEYDHPEVWRAVDRIVNKAHARGIIVAANIGYAFTTPDQIIERVHKLHQHGIRICLMQGADVMFENHAKALLSEVRGVLS